MTDNKNKQLEDIQRKKDAEAEKEKKEKKVTA